MASKEILKIAGLRLTLDGQNEFTQGLKIAGNEVQTAESKLKLLQAQHKITGQTGASLGEQTRLLGEKYKAQQQRVEKLRQVLEATKKEYDGNSYEVKRLERELIDSEATLQRYQNNWQKSSEALELHNSKLKATADQLDKWGGRLTSAGEKMSSAGTKLSIGLTVPLTLLGKKSIDAAKDFESGMAGVRKTVDMTDEEFQVMSDNIRKMAMEIPASTEEIAGVAEAAGQLGIQKENILDFTRVIIDMGNATNLSAEQGATQMARFANIVQMSQQDFSRLGSTIVELGNNYATTESEIMDMAMRLAGAGAQAGMTEGDILGIATALSSLGLEAQAGGSAFSKAMTMIQVQVETGGEALEDYARIAGMSAQEFAELWGRDAAGALAAFVTGLGNMDEHGKSATVLLDELGIKELRLSDALKRTSGSQDLMVRAIKMGNEAWAENNALTEEANQRYATSESKLEVQKNKMKDAAIELGQKLMPVMLDFMDVLSDLITSFTDLDEGTQKTIIYAATAVGALGPLLKVLGPTAKGLGHVASGLGALFNKAAEAKAAETAAASVGALGASGEVAATGLGKVATVLTGPVGMIALAGLAAGAIYKIADNLYGMDSEARKAKESIDRLTREFDKSVGAADAQKQIIDETITELDKLTKAENKTATEKEKIRVLVEKLNSLMPDLNLEYLAEKDALSQSTDAIKQHAAEYTNMLKVKAGEEYLSSLYKEQFEIMGKINERTENLADLRKELKTLGSPADLLPGTAELQRIENLGNLIAQEEKGIKQLQGQYDEAERRAGQASKQINEWTQATTEAVKQSTEEKEKAYENERRSYKNHIAETIRLVDEEKAVGETRKNLTEEELKKIEKLHEEYGKDLNRLLNENLAKMGAIDKKGIAQSKLTAKEVKKNLLAQIKDWENWREEIQKLVSRVPPDVMKGLEDLGPGFTALIKDLNKMSDKELDEFIAIWRKKTNLAGQAAQEELDKMPKYAVIVGQNFGDSLATGMLKSKWKIAHNAALLANEAINQTKKTFMLRSPSKIGTDIGYNYGSAIGIGIDKSIGVVSDKSVKLAKSAVESTSRIASQGVIDLTAELNRATALKAEINRAYRTQQTPIERMTAAVAAAQADSGGTYRIVVQNQLGDKIFNEFEFEFDRRGRLRNISA